MAQLRELGRLSAALAWGLVGCVSVDGPNTGGSVDGGAPPVPVGTDGGQLPPTPDAAPPALDAGPGTAATDAAVDAGSSPGADAGAPVPVGAPSCSVPPASQFLPNTTVGGGGSQFTDSEHFRFYGSSSNLKAALNHLEAAHKCFEQDWCFRSTGLSALSDAGPYYKLNVYAVASLGSAAGVMRYDERSGLSYLQVLAQSAADPRVTVHEYGHALTLSEHRWVDQTRTGAWWETVANWVADTYQTSRYCEAARKAFGVATGQTLIDLAKVIGQSNMLIVSDQNYYEAWPFLTYLSNNPDGYRGLGQLAVPNLFRNHQRNDETPLHVLERVASPVRVQTILGRYWARMAYLDIGHPQAQAAFFQKRSSLNFANLDALGNQTYRVKSSRRPAYGGANIIPLNGKGAISVALTNLGNGRSESGFTATLAIRASGGSVRYVDLPDGAGEASVGADEEASLVVVNTPSTLYQYDAFNTTTSSPESIGLNYQVVLAGASPTN
jgi:hypothetical protein